MSEVKRPEMMTQRMPEQGCLTECVYCSRVRPGLGQECPECHGERKSFRQARMMDVQTAFDDFLGMCKELTRIEDELAVQDNEDLAVILRRRYLALLDHMHIHSVDPFESICHRLRLLEDRFELG